MERLTRVSTKNDMKITLIHGQNHRGSTYHIARMAAQKISEDIEEFFLPRDFGEGCAGCLACLNKGREHCPNSAKVKPILDSMLSSQVIVVGSPTYVMEMSAHIKSFFEHIFTAWIAHRPEERMFGKVAVVVSTAAGMGMSGVTKSLKKQMVYLCIPKVYRLPFRVASSSWEGVSPRLKARIAAKTDSVARAVLSGKGLARPGLKLKFLFMMMRMSQKTNEYAPLDREYWNEKGWLGKARPWKRVE